MIDLAARHLATADAVEARVRDVLRSGRWIGGPAVAEAEALCAGLLGRRGAVGTNSGTDALMLALQAVGVRPGDEVLVPAVSFFATAGAVAAIGAEPVAADVGEDGILAAVAPGPRTRAVVLVHLFGNRAEPSDVGVPIVDDAAQAVGGDPPRSVGALTAVSTYPTKIWGGAGDGGFVAGDDPELLDRVRRLGNHGLVGDRHERVGASVGRNCRLDAIQGAVLAATAEELPQRIARRRATAERYDRELPTRVRRFPRHAGNPVPVYVIRVDERDRVARELAARGVETRAYYPRPLPDEPALTRRGPTPVADAMCRELLALPVHEGLSDDDVTAVIAALHEVA